MRRTERLWMLLDIEIDSTTTLDSIEDTITSTSNSTLYMLMKCQSQQLEVRWIKISVFVSKFHSISNLDCQMEDTCKH